jgi:hypothetical protein
MLRKYIYFDLVSPTAWRTQGVWKQNIIQQHFHDVSSCIQKITATIIPQMIKVSFMDAWMAWIMIKNYENLSLSFISFLCEYFFKEIRDLWVNSNKDCLQNYRCKCKYIYIYTYIQGTFINYLLLLQMIIAMDNVQLLYGHVVS